MLIVNVPVAVFAATVADAGTVKAESPVRLKVTTAPLAPAALESVTVQLLEAFAPNVVGLHCTDETTVGATREMVADFEDPPYEAVTVAF